MNTGKKIREKRNKSKILFTAFAALVVVAIVIAVILGYRSGIQKSDDNGFTAFAKAELRNHQLYGNVEARESYFEYSRDFSFAVRKTEIEQEDISEFRDCRIDKIISKCREEGFGAVIVDSADFTSNNGVVSIYIACRKYSYIYGKPIRCTSDVKTYLFDRETGREINPNQAIYLSYRIPASKYADNFIEAAYNKRILKKDYRKYTGYDLNNFNKFIIDGSRFVFIFDEDTVVKKSAGLVSVPVQSRALKKSLRPVILERYIDPSKPMVALTYDDGPGGKAERRILDTLYENNAVATFFYLGSRISSAPENLIRAVDIGCEVGNHSWKHHQYSLMSKDAVKKEISKTNDKIEDCCGVKPVVGRPPYGDYSSKTIKASSVAQILWTVDTRDWYTRNAKSTFKAVKKKKNLDGKIILMHSIYNETADATELIVPWLKEHGYQTVTVSELIEYKTGKEPEKGKLYRELD